MPAPVNKGGRPRKLPKDKTFVGLELPDVIVAGYEEWLAELQATVPGGAGSSRADLMRDVLARALAEHQHKKPSKGPARRSSSGA